MRDEPAVIIGIIAAVLQVLALFGLSREQQDVIKNLAIAIIPAITLLGAWWTRTKVFSPTTVLEITNEAAITGEVPEEARQP